jgi:Phage terminase, small subunit
MKLTQRQELFCQSYIETGNASEAYRASYSTARMKPETIHRAACRLMRVSNICTRIDELRAAATKIVVLDKAMVLDDLIRIKNEAMAPDFKGSMTDATAAIRALELLGKHLALWQPDTMLAVQVNNNGRESFEDVLKRALYIGGGTKDWEARKAQEIGQLYQRWAAGETLPEEIIVGGLPDPFRINGYVIETSGPLPEGTTISGPDHDFIAVPRKCETTEEWTRLASAQKDPTP